jgi:hypothetical protein
LSEEIKSIESKLVYEFGGFRVDLPNRLVLRDGEGCR